MRYRRHMLEHRLQILLDDGRYRKVAQESQRRGVSMAAVIRDAIDQLPTPVELRRTAIDALLAAAPLALPMDPTGLRHELDAAHDPKTPTLG